MYPWPLPECDQTLDDALRIAMDYLQVTGQANEFIKVQRLAAGIVLEQWRKGVRHPIRLANTAIVTIESNSEAEVVRSFLTSSWQN
jgi:hypothetical protein